MAVTISARVNQPHKQPWRFAVASLGERHDDCFPACIPPLPILLQALSAQEETMPHYPYLIVGGGMAAAAAIQGIREVDSTGAIGLIGAEAHPPYQRPPLSKALWKDAALDSVWIDLPQQGLDLLLERR